MAEILPLFFRPAGGLITGRPKLAPGKEWGQIWSWFTDGSTYWARSRHRGYHFWVRILIGEFHFPRVGQLVVDGQRHVVLLTAILLLIQGLLNTFGVNIVSLFTASRWVAPHPASRSFVILLFIRAPLHSHQSEVSSLVQQGFDASRTVRIRRSVLRLPPRISWLLNTPSLSV